MNDDNRENDDILDMDESSSSSSSNTGVFEALTPFVLELHDIRKDEPMPNEHVPPDTRKKHRRKKKGQPARERSNSSVSSDSLSETGSLPPAAVAPEPKEEFYDAHESYHAISNRDKGPVIATARLQAHSETNQNPKANPTSLIASEEQTTTTTTSTTRKEPSTITKPTLPPQ